MADCEGIWREVPTPDETGSMAAFRCSGCADYMVVLNGRGYDAPGATTVEEAVRAAMVARYVD